MSDEGLIDAFNGDVGNPGWVSARAQFHYALHEEFDNRGFDYLDIGNKNSYSLKNKIKLIGKKIIKQTMNNSTTKSNNLNSLYTEEEQAFLEKYQGWNLPPTQEEYQRLVELEARASEDSSTSETPKTGQTEATKTYEISFVPNKPKQSKLVEK